MYKFVVEEVKCIYGEILLLDVVFGVDGCIVYIIWKLIGVIGVIILFNFLLNLVVYKVGLVIVVGNIVVLKLVD